MHPVQMSMGRDGKTPFERLHGKKPTQEFVPFGATVLATPISTDPEEQNESQIPVRDFGFACETTVQNVELGLQMVYPELVKSKDWGNAVVGIGD